MLGDNSVKGSLSSQHYQAKTGQGPDNTVLYSLQGKTSNSS